MRADTPPAGPEITWDFWGVPHLRARTPQALFFAFGWAQMASHGRLLLRLYGKARGRAAEYWGHAQLASDCWVRLLGIPARARRWRAAQSPEFGACLDAFARGINAYAAHAPGTVDAELAVVLPVSATDVLAHVQAIVHGSLLSDSSLLRIAAEMLAGRPDVPRAEAASMAGSNAWVVGPQRTSGATLLLGNPHLLWRDAHLFYEAHWKTPTIDFYGATLIGFPVPTLGFNRCLGWTHTMNRPGGVSLYDLKLTGGGYRYDGAVRRFRESRHSLRVLIPRGRFRIHRLIVRRSVHGPLIGRRGRRAIALRLPGLDTSGICDQWWRMACATTLSSFERAIEPLQLPIFNLLYADRRGHLMHLYGGRVPMRSAEARATTLPGDRSAACWTRTHPYVDLPRVVDPPTGWLQNANDSPWTDTLPAVLDRRDYPAYLPDAPPTARAIRAMRLLADDRRISLSELVRHKDSTRSELADVVVPELVHLARADGRPLLRRAAAVLQRWDRHTRPTSRGAVLFWRCVETALRSGPGISFRKPWCPDAPLATPSGLVAPRRLVRALWQAARSVQDDHGALDVQWGQVYRLRSGSLDLPAAGGPGALGVLRVLEFEPDADGRYRACAGDSFMFAVAYGPRGALRARVLLTYGNASEPGAPRRTDQLRLFARGAWRRPWLKSSEIRRHEVRRDRLPSPGGSRR